MKLKGIFGREMLPRLMRLIRMVSFVLFLFLFINANAFHDFREILFTPGLKGPSFVLCKVSCICGFRARGYVS